MKNLESREYPHVVALRCAPLPVVRIAFIGLGHRGRQSLVHYMYLDGVEVRAVCDLQRENREEARAVLESHGMPAADEYGGADDWKEVCRRDDIDLVYVCTSIRLHADIAVYAMEHGKHVACEVPIANTIADCWRIVDAAERCRRHCMMLENCCYDRFEMAALHLCSQGAIGEVTHAEGSYVHDLSHIDFAKRPDYIGHWLTTGNPYPTHGLGPLCQAMKIHRGDRLARLVSVSNRQFNYPEVAGRDMAAECRLGNMNTTIVTTLKSKTMVLQHDISSPRPYERRYLLSGTHGFVERESHGRMKSLVPGVDEMCEQEAFFARYDHPFYQSHGDLARRVGAHGGMDFMMDYRLIHCLRQGLPLDMDVYDGVEWSSLVELTRLSVEQGGCPVDIPDFTRGAWNLDIST